MQESDQDPARPHEAMEGKLEATEPEKSVSLAGYYQLDSIENLSAARSSNRRPHL
jgi:hypothetical protein